MSRGADRSVSEWLEHRARSDRDRPFCCFDDGTITFGALAEQVDRLAAGWQAAGIRPGEHVALMLPNHPDHMVAILALARVGAVHVPINVHFRAAGLQHVLEHAQVTAVVADAACHAELSQALEQLPRITRVIWRGGPDRASSFEELARHAGAVLPLPPDLDRPIAILYTSGTTGPSKGVIMTERMYHAAARSAALAADVRPGDVLFLWEPLYHITGIQAIVVCLTRGVACALVDRFSASRFWSQVRRYRATQIHYLGGVIGILMKQPPRPDDGDNPVRVAWGAACPPALWRPFEQRFGVTVRECYGLTEGSSFTAVNDAGRVGSVGRPVPHFEVRIVDQDDRPLGPHQVGEIVQRGREPGVITSGYFNDPAATARALRGGWLHTGDLGYYDEEGLLYYSGRAKDSIRTRGENVSAWEVEQAVLALPGVEECAAIGVPSELGESDIKLFVRPAPGITLDPLEIVRWCDQRLAYFQVPRFVALVNDFPRTPSQRIRKDELPRATVDCWDRDQSGYQVRRPR